MAAAEGPRPDAGPPSGGTLPAAPSVAPSDRGDGRSVPRDYQTVFTNAKAGMEGVDKEHVQRVVYEMSKDSAHFKNEQRKQAQVDARISAMKEQAARYGGAELAAATRAIDERVALLEAGRDLSHTWIVVDMDAFFASVEELDRPELKRVPMAVGSLGMICTANYAARKFGVRSAMPGFIGRRLCPQLVFVKPDFTKYTAACERTRTIFRRYDPDLEAASLDEAYLDVTGYCRHHGVSGEEVAERIRREVREECDGLTCSCGVSCNKTIAKICSDINKPDGQYALPPTREAIMSFLATLPVRKIPGIGKVAEQELTTLGMARCGELLGQRRGLLTLLFSELSCGFFLSAALGLGSTQHAPKVDTAVEPGRKGISCERTFRAISDKAQLEAIATQLCEAVAADMAKERIEGRTLTLKIKRSNFEVRTRAASLPRHLSAATDLMPVALKLLRAEFPMELRLMGVRMSNLRKINPAANSPLAKLFRRAAPTSSAPSSAPSSLQPSPQLDDAAAPHPQRGTAASTSYDMTGTTSAAAAPSTSSSPQPLLRRTPLLRLPAPGEQRTSFCTMGGRLLQGASGEEVHQQPYGAWERDGAAALASEDLDFCESDHGDWDDYGNHGAQYRLLGTDDEGCEEPRSGEAQGVPRARAGAAAGSTAERGPPRHGATLHAVAAAGQGSATAAPPPGAALAAASTAGAASGAGASQPSQEFDLTLDPSGLPAAAAAPLRGGVRPQVAVGCCDAGAEPSLQQQGPQQWTQQQLHACRAAGAAGLSDGDINGLGLPPPKRRRTDDPVAAAADRAGPGPPAPQRPALPSATDSEYCGGPFPTEATGHGSAQPLMETGSSGGIPPAKGPASKGAAPAGRQAAAGAGPWACRVCTYALNRRELLRCEVCDCLRGSNGAPPPSELQPSMAPAAGPGAKRPRQPHAAAAASGSASSRPPAHQHQQHARKTKGSLESLFGNKAQGGYAVPGPGRGLGAATSRLALGAGAAANTGSGRCGGRPGGPAAGNNGAVEQAVSLCSSSDSDAELPDDDDPDGFARPRSAPPALPPARRCEHCSALVVASAWQEHQDFHVAQRLAAAWR